jgi:hypothetical protein
VPARVGRGSRGMSNERVSFGLLDSAKQIR